VPIDSVDAAYRLIDAFLPIPATSVVLTAVQLEFASVQYAGTGAAIRIDDVQVLLETGDPNLPVPTIASRVQEINAGPLVLDDSTSASDQKITGALIRFDESDSGGPAVKLERRDGDTSLDPPHLWLRGLMTQVGLDFLNSRARAQLPRVEAPFSNAGTSLYTLMWESIGQSSGIGVRVYMGPGAGGSAVFVATVNAQSAGANWKKDDDTVASTRFEVRPDGADLMSMPSIGDGGSSPFADGAWASAPAVTPFNFGGHTGVDATNLLATFAGRFDIGAGLLATAGASTQPRIKTERATFGVNPKTLVHEFNGLVGGTTTMRLYHVTSGADEGQEFTVNAGAGRRNEDRDPLPAQCGW
jgi:hypothetical protein